MPVNDDLVRRLTMAGLDHDAAQVLAEKHGEQRVVKLRVTPTTPHILDGTLSAFTLQPGEQLLGYSAAVAEVFHTPRRGVLSAPSAPTLPLVAASASGMDSIPIGKASDPNPPGVTLAHATYSTIGALVIGLNAGTDPDAIGTWSAVNGKLVLTCAEFVTGLTGSQTGLTTACGFAGLEQTVGAVAPYLSVFAVGAESLTELAEANLAIADVDEGSGLLTPSTSAGVVSTGGSGALGYLPPTAAPIAYGVALRNSMTGDLLTAGDVTSGDAFLWVWLSSMF